MVEKLSNYTVLYAEDEEGIRKNLAEMLTLLFHRVLVAQNGEEAYELYKKYSPDLIITDIKMPKLNGIELVKKIRKEDKITQIIINSAHTEVDYMLEAVELSLIRYIVKPITSTKLNEALEKFLELQNFDKIIDLADEWKYDKANKIVLHNETIYELTKKELSLLELFLLEKSVITYAKIELELWENESMSLNALRLFMKNFRKKLPPNYIKNIQGVGYKL